MCKTYINVLDTQKEFSFLFRSILACYYVYICRQIYLYPQKKELFYGKNNFLLLYSPHNVSLCLFFLSIHLHLRIPPLGMSRMRKKGFRQITEKYFVGNAFLFSWSLWISKKKLNLFHDINTLKEMDLSPSSLSYCVLLFKLCFFHVLSSSPTSMELYLRYAKSKWITEKKRRGSFFGSP